MAKEVFVSFCSLLLVRMSPGELSTRAMYIMNAMVVRRGRVRLVEAVQRAPDRKRRLS